MAIFYLDSSALVKNYIEESGSEYVKEVLNFPGRNLIYTVSITKVEVVSALTRCAKRIGQTEMKIIAKPRLVFKSDFADYIRTIEVDHSLIDSAVSFAEITICGDMIQSSWLRQYNYEKKWAIWFSKN